VETDSTGWGSTTSNSVDVILSSDGQTQNGDIRRRSRRFVRNDSKASSISILDADAVYGHRRAGHRRCHLKVVGQDSTVTDGTGKFAFTVAPGLHSVREEDLAGYFIVNDESLLQHLGKPGTAPLNLEFGDVYEGSLDFTVVSVGATDRALSVARPT
jgi:hypothetical protein